jgi:cell division protein FtsB
MDIRIKIPSLPKPEAGIRVLVVQAPRAEACAEQMLERCRPGLAWIKGAYRRLATVAVALLTLWVLVHVVFGANGMVVYRQKRAEYQDLSKEVQDLQTLNDRYSAQIKALQSDPNTIEKEAREQLHYARPGEVVYVEPPPAPGQKPSLDAARK